MVLRADVMIAAAILTAIQAHLAPEDFQRELSDDGEFTWTVPARIRDAWLNFAKDLSFFAGKWMEEGNGSS